MQLGDYLDEEGATPVIAKPKPAPPVTPRPVVPPPPSPSVPSPPPAPPEVSAPRSPAAKPLPVQRPAVPRKQVNMKPQTLAMTDEIVRFVQTYSVQKDAKASEVFDALVSALYDALGHLDLSQVPPRGRWGTPTARAFPAALKSAFERAIAEHYATRGQ